MNLLKPLYRWWVKRRHKAAVADFVRHAEITADTGVRTPKGIRAANRLCKWTKQYLKTMSETAAPHGSGTTSR